MKKESTEVGPNIRLITVDEHPSLFKLIVENRGRLQDYFPNTVRAVGSLEAARTFLEKAERQRVKRQQYVFGMYLADELIGYINVKNIVWEIPKCELGYFIDKRHEGRGWTAYCLQKSLDFCFKELKMKKIFLRIDPQNIGSKKVAEKIGFVIEGVLRREFRVSSGELIDVAYYGHIGP